jgi:outer membrane protein assembly factor BamB
MLGMHEHRSGSGGFGSTPHHWQFIAFTLLLLTLAIITATPPAESSPWTEWRGDIHHTAPNDSFDVPDRGELIWSFQTGDQIYSSPVFYDGGLIIGSDDGWLYCLDPASGALNWKFRTGGAVQATALLLGDRAYFGSFDGQFYCISLPEPGSGGQPRLVWNFTCSDKVISSAHAHEGRIYFAELSGTVHCLTIEGAHVWSEKVSERDIWASPCLDPERGLLYIGDIGKGFYSLNMATGKLVRPLYLDDRAEVYSSAALVNDMIYICTGEQRELLCLDPDDLSIIWTFFCDDACYSTPNIKNGRVYFSSYLYLWCVPDRDPDGDGNISENEMFWRVDINGFQIGSSPFVADGKVLVGSDGEGYKMFCINATDGNELWNVSANGYIYSSPVVFNGYVFYGSSDRSVHCTGMLPPGIKVTLETDRTDLLSNQTLELLVTLKDSDGVPVQGANVAFDLSAGTVSKDGLTPYYGSFVSGADGRVKVDLLPPPVSSRSTVIVTVEASHSGLTKGRTSLTLVVEPAEGDTTGQGPSYVDPQRPYYILGFIGLVLVNVIILSALIGLTLLFRKMTKEANR